MAFFSAALLRTKGCLSRCTKSAGGQAGKRARFWMNSTEVNCRLHKIEVMRESKVWPTSRVRQRASVATTKSARSSLDELPQSWDVFSRVFQADGTTTQDAVQVNTYTVGDQYQPRVASVGGLQMAVWTSLGQDGSWEGVYGRLLVAGIPAGEEIRVNNSTASKQLSPVVAAWPDGRFLAVWSGIARGTSFDVFGRGFDGDEDAGGALAAADTSAASGAGMELLRATAGSATGVVAPLPPTSLSQLTAASKTPLRVAMALNRHARELRWNTVAGSLYQVQISTNLTDWTNFGAPRTAAGAGDTLALTGEQSVAFFRVILVK